MTSIDLRPCPFCAHPRPTSVAVGRDRIERIAIFCPACGAIGPRATSDDAPDAAEQLWNSRTAVSYRDEFDRPLALT